MIRASAVWVVLLAGVAWGDEVWVGQLPYKNATVVGLEGDKVVYTVGSARITRALSEVTKIYIGAMPALNNAEDRTAAGQYDEGLKDYQAALSAAPEGWQRDLVTRRRDRALKLKENPPPKVGPATPSPAPAAGERCATCNGVGWTPCLACAAPEKQPLGKVTCKDCGGKGFREEGTLGKIACATCAGTGLMTCPTCHGIKKNACPRCDAGKLVADMLKQAAPQTSSAPAKGGEDDLAALRKLAGTDVDAFVKLLPQPPPRDPNMTDLQFEATCKKVGDEVDAFFKAAKGKEVLWKLTVDDVRQGWSGRDSYCMYADVAVGSVCVTFPKSAASALAKFKKDSVARVRGRLTVPDSSTIRAYSERNKYTYSRPRFFSGGSRYWSPYDCLIRLDGTGVEPADDK